MASSSVIGTSVQFGSVSCNLKQSQVTGAGLFSSTSAIFPVNRRSFPSLKSHGFQISCAAKPETVTKVCKIVRKQLALPDDSSVTGESKLTALGADSLDTVEIVMGLEEEFGISVEEESAQSITTVQEAADMIEKLMEKSA
ncbi:hypothetical protein SAY86_007882 [Trapa natans]|uniref:Acyl carrier protein n=1 Tax=Trapa natans TaxID=22666 RepID=A0AAN7L943_TRANT|nr:hypothetical protein SAY86_007882 [Trapa natans]